MLQKAGSDVLQLQTVPVPTPAANQVLIRIYAAAVNPADYKSGAPRMIRFPAVTLPESSQHSATA